MSVSISGAGSISGLDQGFNVTTGSVGIGTDNPTQKLELLSTGNTIVKLGGGSANTTGIIINRGGSEVSRISHSNSDDLSFYTTSSVTERLRITSDGDVGIGTDNPQSLLSLYQSGGGFEVNANSGSNNARLLSYDRPAGVYRDMTFQALSYVFETSGSERLRITSGGDVQITDGNLVLANGHGIDFSDTSNSQYVMSSELFDDYEEGTWTPTMGFANSYGTQSGKYVKVGKTVHIWFEVQVTAWSTYTGSTRITSSPFPIDKVTGCWAGVINATATTRDWRIGPWTAGGYGMAVWMENGAGSATSNGIRMSENTFSDYSSLTGSLGTNFTMKGGMTYISTT